jgi:hypothetical protein
MTLNFTISIDGSNSTVSFMWYRFPDKQVTTLRLFKKSWPVSE